jgi:hypothetical protein
MNAVRYISIERRGGIAMAYSPFLDRSKLRGSTAVQQMAQDFLVINANAGSVSQDDLEILGWSPAQITLHASAARQFANRQAEG